MTTYKLTYFDMDGGRAEPARIAFHAGGIAFEDNRVAFPEFAKMRATTPFNAVPVLEIDGVPVTQSNSINRYVGRLAGLYPQDAMQALYCDEVMDATEDLIGRVVATFGLQGDELEAAREKLVEGWLTTFLRGFDGLLSRGGGEYFAGGELSVADLKVFIQMRSLQRGVLDHVPVDLVERLTPALAKHRDRVAEHPAVVAYYAR